MKHLKLPSISCAPRIAGIFASTGSKINGHISLPINVYAINALRLQPHEVHKLCTRAAITNISKLNQHWNQGFGWAITCTSDIIFNYPPLLYCTNGFAKPPLMLEHWQIITFYKKPWIWSQIARFMGPTWGPPGSCRPQIYPMLTPWTLLSGMCYPICISHNIC